MKLTKKEQELILQRRKFIKTKNKSSKILRYRKAAKMSTGEKRVAEILASQNIEFKQEWFFRDLYNKQTKQLLYFDFYLPGYNLCIEYDGEQHYNPTRPENQKINDFLKNAYCKKNGIPLLRIKYSDFDKCEEIICQFFDKVDPVIRT